MPPRRLYAEYQGATALVDAYLATEYDDARLLSVGGPAEATRAVVAALANGYQLPLFHLHDGTREEITVLSPSAGTKWHLAVRRLPCGQVHGLLYPQTSLAAARHSFTLLLPQADKGLAPAHLLRMIDARTTFPLHPSWAPWLWTLARESGWLLGLQGEGAWIGWDVNWEERRLERAVVEALERRSLDIR